ncbi:hypothetical protein [Petroclostridium sp. X23]|uniref:hypothetical protein n=1 Tax=Petroclostridium sp. X23 TaxID=3045146 RepID=UPI0024ACAAB9|nr:hypothetical protein [Petroclostridium sp. X23]WHH61081.1 hypothetical protein QKW49_10395 [Petroclostridium sp. X23]
MILDTQTHPLDEALLIHTELIDNKKLTPMEKFTYIVIHRFTIDNAFELDKVIELTGLKEDELNRVMRKLEEEGLIELVNENGYDTVEVLH